MLDFGYYNMDCMGRWIYLILLKVGEMTRNGKIA